MNKTPNRQKSKLKDSPFIKKLKESHYIILPKEILFGYPELTMQEKLCYGYLVHYGNISIVNNNVDDNGNPIVYPSQTRLSNEMGISQSTVSRYVKKLEASKLVRINDLGNGKNNWVTVLSPGDLCTDESETDAQVNTEPMHGCIQDIRDTKTGESKKTGDVPVSDKLLKPSKRVTQSNQTVQDIISKHMSRQPKPTKPKENPSGKRVVDARNSKTLYQHYTEVYHKKFGSKPPASSGKDLKLLKDMINYYDYDRVVEFIDFAVLYFDTFQRDKRIQGKPTIGMIWGFRAYIEEKADIFKEKPETGNDTGESDSEWY
jgi:hypothetical protein